MNKGITARKAKKDFLKAEEQLHEVMERKLHKKEMAKHKDKKKPMLKKPSIEIEIEIERKEKRKKKDPMPAGKKKMREAKIKKVMKEFDEGKLHSGSKKGPIVTNKRQALAIGYSEAKRAKKKKK